MYDPFDLFPFHYKNVQDAALKDSKLRDLTLIQGEEEIPRQVICTVRYTNPKYSMQEAMTMNPCQVINRLKALKKKYRNIMTLAQNSAAILLFSNLSSGG